MIIENSADDAVSTLINCFHYETIIVSRILAASGCLVVSLAVLIVIPVVLRRKAWENRPKRLFIACSIFTGVNSILVLAGIDYSHKSLRSPDIIGPCLELAFTLHYTGSLIASSYVALVLALLFHVTLPVCSPVGRRSLFYRISQLSSGRRNKIVAEVVLFLAVILSPAVLTTWEPYFLADLPTYGSNGLWCDYQRHIPQNCSERDDLYLDDTLYLSTIPYAVVAVLCWVALLLVVVVLCGLWVKFKQSFVGKRIINSARSVALLLIVASAVVLWLYIYFSCTHPLCQVQT